MDRLGSRWNPPNHHLSNLKIIREESYDGRRVRMFIALVQKSVPLQFTVKLVNYSSHHHGAHSFQQFEQINVTGRVKRIERLMENID